MLEGIGPVFDALKSEVDAVHVGLKELWIFVLQIDRPSWVLCNPLRLAGSREKSRLGDEDVGVESEACGLRRRWIADNDVEGVLKIVTAESKHVAALMTIAQKGTYAERLSFAAGCSGVSMVEDLLADLPPVLFLAVCLVRITVQAGWCVQERGDKILWALSRSRMLVKEGGACQ